MARINLLDKRSGITYVYESVSYWDKEKKQPRSKRTLIGRLDPETGNIVPIDGRGKRRNRKEEEVSPKRGPVPVARTDRLFFGATYLLDQIGLVSEITEDLKACFPNTYKQILSIAYYLVLEDQNPLFRFKKWASLHRHTYGKDIPSLRSTELFQSITEEAKMQFFRLQGKRRVESTGHTTALPSPAVQRCSSRSNMGRTRMTIICLKSIWRWYLAKNPSFRFTTASLPVMCRM